VRLSPELLSLQKRERVQKLFRFFVDALSILQAERQHNGGLSVEKNLLVS